MEERLKASLDGLGVVLGQGQIDSLIKFSELLLYRNRIHNLTAITDPDEVVTKHLADSLSLVPHLLGVGSVVDVGTGAGLPGLVLAVALPQCSFCLMDAQSKRVAFVSEAASVLGLSNVRAVQVRAEEAGRLAYRESFEVAVARAVAPLGILAEYSLPLVQVGGKFLAMKGQGEEQDIEVMPELGGELSHVSKVELPLSDIRHIIVTINKINPTQEGFPRSQARIKRQYTKASPN